MQLTLWNKILVGHVRMCFGVLYACRTKQWIGSDNLSSRGLYSVYQKRKSLITFNYFKDSPFMNKTRKKSLYLVRSGIYHEKNCSNFRVLFRHVPCRSLFWEIILPIPRCKWDFFNLSKTVDGVSVSHRQQVVGRRVLFGIKRKLRVAKGFKNVLARSRLWQNDFWKKSFD